MGWRYVFYSCAAVVFVMSLLRVTVIRLYVSTSNFEQFSSYIILESVNWVMIR
jgi:hypothetical protein